MNRQRHLDADEHSHEDLTRSDQEQVAWDPEVLRNDPVADMLAESFLEEATSGQSADVEQSDTLLEEEIGGPFIETSPEEEFGYQQDFDVPVEPAVFPVANAGRTQAESPELSALQERQDEADKQQLRRRTST